MAETLNIVIENDANLNSSVSNDEWLESIMSDGGEAGNSQQIVPRIHKVPPVLRGINSNHKCYDPMVVSVGPYHHGKQELHEVERIKVTMAPKFVQDSGKPIEVLYNNVEKVANSARKYYDEGSTEGFSNEEFAHMMFLDGCFIIQFIYCFVKKPGDLRMNNHISAHLIKRDMFLLENQLPFQVLNTLMSLRFKEEAEGKKLIKEFIVKHVRGLPPQSESYKQIIMKFVSKYIWPSQTQTRTEKKEIEDHQPVHLLELLHKELAGRKAVFNNFSKKKEDWDQFQAK